MNNIESFIKSEETTNDTLHGIILGVVENE